MTKRIPQPRSELSPGIRTHEAKLLAVMLRTSRLTCVFGEPGTDKTALLKSGVMPLLQRRYADRAFSSTAPSADFSGSDRRRATGGAAASRRVEAAIYFDAWGDAPLADLKFRIADIVPPAARAGWVAGCRLTQTLEQLNRQSGMHIVFLLDRFEEFLAAPADRPGVTSFAAELLDALLHPNLPASFLIALEESARPRLERFRRQIPGFDHNFLRLSPILTGSPAGLQPDGPAPRLGNPMPAPMQRRVEAAGTTPRRRGPPPRVPIKVEEVYAFIESMLAKTAGGRTDDSWSLPRVQDPDMKPAPSDGAAPSARAPGTKPPERG